MNWRQEGIKAGLTFGIFIGSAFMLTGDNPVDSWSGWGIVTVLAGIRVAVSSLVASLATWQASRK